MANPDCDMRGHMEFLRSIAKGRILETGVRGGASTAAFLYGLEKNGGTLYSVDIADYSRLVEDHPRWRFLQADSGDFLKVREFIGPEPLDVLFIDGDHDYEAVKRDLEYAELVRPGGTIALHDICNDNEPGVAQAFYEFLPSLDEYLVRTESCGLGVVWK